MDGSMATKNLMNLICRIVMVPLVPHGSHNWICEIWKNSSSNVFLKVKFVPDYSNIIVLFLVLRSFDENQCNSSNPQKTIFIYKIFSSGAQICFRILKNQLQNILNREIIYFIPQIILFCKTDSVSKCFIAVWRHLTMLKTYSCLNTFCLHFCASPVQVWGNTSHLQFASERAK